jgi:hypothetical protein
VFHVVVWLASGAPSLQGPVTWRKPIEFGVSGAITSLSLAWVLGRLPRSTFWDWSAAIAVVFFVPETALIDMQQWRGVASHFNYETGFDSAVFSAMGICIGVVAIGIAILAIRSFGQVEGPPSTRLAIRAGMIFLLLGQVLGGLILANQFATNGPLAGASIVGAAGELKVPHALALHGLQALAILAVILERARVRLSPRAAAVAVACCAVGYGLLLAAATVQTYSGLGPLALTPWTLVVALVGMAFLAGPYVIGLNALEEPGTLLDSA